ncbi:MAG: RecX family transcriptional regulator [Bacteroidales bacterium]|nr:RecX family transcriptional regulator [Bacteroidales bacterium]
MKSKTPKVYSYDELLSKAQAYCAYQERCTSEVADKLKSLGAGETTINSIIERLKEDDFIDEKRFAEAFAHGKFSSRQWGRLKIKAALYQKQIAEKHIQQALHKIDEESYRRTLQNIVEKKAADLKQDDPLTKKQKVYRYALSKGYESSLIWAIISACL